MTLKEIKETNDIKFLDDMLGVVMTDYTRAKLFGDIKNMNKFTKEADAIEKRIQHLKKEIAE